MRLASSFLIITKNARTKVWKTRSSTPATKSAGPMAKFNVVKRLGGLLNYYYRAAA